MNSSSPIHVADAVRALIDESTAALSGTPLAGELAAIAERLDGPLRVAIAGRVKAGKSTLLNALVGERLAPTDAGECTRIVSWYQQGNSYQVTARLKAGGQQALAFRRAEGHLEIELGGLSEASVAWLDVRWPASTLSTMTLIDTPGLASINDENSRRTREFLAHDAETPSDADAVIYLMRHVHRSDIEFLDAFMDRSVSAASPVNAVAVLSRADEIGAGRPDAMASAERIATRYGSDPQVRSLCATVVPMAGLLAETGLTWREDEMAALRGVCAAGAETVERMCLSAEQFCAPDVSEVPVEQRRDLLDRLGMYGVRRSVDAISTGQATTAVALSGLLVQWSGLPRLKAVLQEHFGPRARTLQARSALVSLRALAVQARSVRPAAADRIDREAERIEASALEFGRLRAAHLVTTGGVRVSERERGELERLLMAPSPTAALGLGPSADAATVRDEALALVNRWRSRAGEPMADPRLVEVCEVAARLGEAMYASSG